MLSWEGLPRPAVQRSRRWYITTGVVVLLAAAYGIFTGSWSFAIVCVLAGGMYSLIHDHQPSPISIALYDSGVMFNGDFIRWDQLQGFWFLRTPSYTELRLVPLTPRKRMGRTSWAGRAAPFCFVR